MAQKEEKVQKREKKLAYDCPPTNPQPHPWLLISHGKSRDRHVFYSISENRYYYKSIPELCDRNIRKSCHGWLILQDRCSGEISLFNMASLEEIEIIPKPKFYYTDCILSAPPTDPDCRIVFFDSNSDDSSIIFYCKPGDDNFEKQDLGINGNAFYSTTIFQGNIYGYIANTTELVMLDFDGVIPKAKIVINGTFTIPTYNISYDIPILVEFCNGLFLVQQKLEGELTPSIDSFSILKADFSQKTWIEVNSIGENSALFLTPNTEMCCQASPDYGIKGNTVYFMRYFDPCLYSFDLEDQSFTTHPPCPGVNRCTSRYSWVTMDFLAS